jgi:hypothetical protein
MTEEWKRRVTELRYWQDQQEFLEFVELVEMAVGKCDLETCRILMQTFVTEEDYGALEAVCRVLSSARATDRQVALLEELPRMLNDAPEWTDCLVEQELRFHLESLRETLRTNPPLKERLVQFMRRESLCKEFPDLIL